MIDQRPLATTGFWGGRSETAFFFVVCLAQAAPLLLFPWFVNWDGPSHVGSAYILDHWNGGGGEVFRRYLWLDLVPMPNLTSYAVLAALLRVFSPAWAEKIFVGLVVIGFPAAVRYVLGSTRRDGVAFGYLALPLAVGWFVHGGQYNFCLGVTLGLLVVGAWLRHPSTRWAATALLALALVVIFLTHLVALMFTLVFLGVLAGWEGWSTKRWLRFAHVVIAAVPAFLLTVWWELSSDAGPPSARLSLRTVAQALVSMKNALAVFTSKEVLVGLAIVGALGILGLVVLARHRRGLGDRSWGLFAVALAGVALVLLVPNQIGNGGYVTARLSLIPFLAGLAWVAQFDLSPRLRIGAAAVGVVAVVALGVMRLPYYRDFNRDFREYLSASEYIPAGSTVLPLVYLNHRTTPPGTARATYIDPIQELSSWFISRDGALDLAQYEAGFDSFPIQFKRSMSPYRHISDHLFVGEIPPSVDFISYPERTGGSVDFVLTWGLDQAPAAVRDSPEVADVRRQLAEKYELIYTSERGLLELYALRD